MSNNAKAAEQAMRKLDAVELDRLIVSALQHRMAGVEHVSELLDDTEFVADLGASSLDVHITAIL